MNCVDLLPCLLMLSSSSGRQYNNPHFQFQISVKPVDFNPSSIYAHKTAYQSLPSPMLGIYIFLLLALLVHYVYPKFTHYIALTASPFLLALFKLPFSSYIMLSTLWQVGRVCVRKQRSCPIWLKNRNSFNSALLPCSTQGLH